MEIFVFLLIIISSTLVLLWPHLTSSSKSNTKRREYKKQKSYTRSKKDGDFERRLKIKEEIFDIHKRVVDDWTKNHYLDKVKTEMIGGTNVIIYRFENGDTLEVNGSYGKREVIYISGGYKKTYTLGILYWNEVVGLFNIIIRQCNNGTAKKRSRFRNHQSHKSKPKTNEHPKKELYLKLLQNVELREKNLRGMSKDHPDRDELENELKAIKSKVNSMKKKYNF